MPLILSRNDITKVNTDAIVLPANEQLLQGRGTSRAIYLAAGEEKLTEACRKIGHCPVGSAVMTDGFDLPVKAIIHAACPRWQDGNHQEPQLLYSAYQKSLELAADAGFESIAFPLLSAGSYGYPKAGALNVANHAITDFLMDQDMEVQLVFYDSESVAAGRNIFREIEEYIDDNYVGSKDESFTRPGIQYQSVAADILPNMIPEGVEDTDFSHLEGWIFSQIDEEEADQAHTEKLSDEMVQEIREQSGDPWMGAAPETVKRKEAAPSPMADAAMAPMASESRPAFAPARPKMGSLKDRIKSLMKGDSETFHDMLFRLIDESGMSYPQVYNRANMSKKLFSKIKLNPDSTPKKKNIIALAIALRLDMEQTEELLMKAGYALSNSSMADVIVSYFIEKRIYDVFEINEALFEYGLENDLLGF